MSQDTGNGLVSAGLDGTNGSSNKPSSDPYIPLKPEKHEHEYSELVEAIEPLRKYVTENGKPVADTITGRDILKQRKCKCGAVQTYDLERKKA